LIEQLYNWHTRIWNDEVISYVPKISPLKIDYQNGVGAYFHEYRAQRPGLGEGIGQLVRIKVSHERPTSIDDVQEVQEIIPPQNIQGVPFHLHRMNDNPLPYQAFHASINLAHRQEEYFDVATYSKFKLNTSVLEFNCIDGKTRQMDEYPAQIVIRVTGKDVQMAECRCTIDVDEQDNLKMTMYQ
jgi:hypothetical protein